MNIDLEQLIKNDENNLLNNKIVRTPQSTKPLNYNPIRSKKSNKKKDISKKSIENFEEISNNNNNSIFNIKNIEQHLMDAILGALILFIVCSAPVNDIISSFFPDFHNIITENISSTQNNQGLILIKKEKKISLKGQLLRIGIFIILFVVVKMWFIK